MDVPALLHIYNRLTLMGDEEIRGGVDSDLEAEPGGFVDEGETEEPVGSFPEPKFRCYVASYNGRADTCKISFIEYTETNHLVFDFNHEYDGSGGICICRVVCDKGNIPEIISALFEAVKSLTTETKVIGVVKGMVQMKISHVHCSFRHQTNYWVTNSVRKVPISAPMIQHNADTIIRTRCDNIARTSDLLRGAATRWIGGQITLLPTLQTPPGPQAAHS